MCDEWMPMIKLPLSWEEFHQLPRNSAYKYEYLDGTTYLSPRPRHYHALLDLQTFSLGAAAESADPVTLRRAQVSDFTELISLFAAAFRRIQPFGSLDDGTRQEAARKALERTRTSGDGPLIERSSFVALEGENPHTIGAIFITLLPDGDPCDWDSYYWREPPPPDAIERRLGRPHLTWIFVSPLCVGHGVGTTLLAAAVRELLELGYTQLASTFMIGNDSSMLWHWRNGFRLLAYPGSMREMRKQGIGNRE
jgi:GNAT superfamily N-acetyltransferase